MAGSMVDRYCRLRHWHRCYWLVADPSLGRLRSWGELLLRCRNGCGRHDLGQPAGALQRPVHQPALGWPAAKLDRLGIFAAENTTTARIDLANPSLSVTIVNAPTFGVDQGYASVLGTGSYINTGAIPGSLTNFQQNSAMFGAGTLSTRSTNSDFSIMGTTQNAGGSNLWLRTSIGTTVYNASSSEIFSGTVTIPVANVKGLYNVNRSAADAQELYMNGASVGTNTEPSAAMLAFSFLVGAFRNADNVSVYAYDTGIVSVYYIGGSFTASEAASFATIINTYMTAVGSPLF